MTKEKLKPCPFCGGTDLRLHESSTCCWVQCEDCFSENGSSRSREKAMRVWNTRAGEKTE